jgi:signal-transduction protein with cAMP-binding, CBS, and nucleotidyltransferase domain
MQTGIKVGEAMTTEPVATTPETTIRDAARLMKEYDVGSVLLKEGDNVVGIVTEFDLTRKVVADDMDTREPVSNVAETALVDILPTRDLAEALQLMKVNEVRHLPVVQDEEFMGLITMKDILKIAPALFDIMVDQIRLREENRKPIEENI